MNNKIRSIIVLLVAVGALVVFFVLTSDKEVENATRERQGGVVIDNSIFKTLTSEYTPGAEVEIRWMISHDPVRYFLQAANTFKEIVEKKSNGKITVRIITLPDGVVGAQRIELRDKAKDLLREGQVDIMQSYTEELFGIEPKLEVLDVPLLFRDYDHVDAVVDGEIGQELLNGFKNSYLEGLAFTFSGGFISFLSNTGNIKSLSELEGKRIGKRKRAENLLNEQLGLAIINEYSTGGSWITLRERFDSGLVDIASVPYLDVFDFIEIGEARSLLHSRHRVVFTILAMNREFFEKLTISQQQIVKEAAMEAARAERKIIESDEDRLLSNKEYASLVHELSTEDLERLKKIAVYIEAEIAKSVGKDIISRIKNTK